MKKSVKILLVCLCALAVLAGSAAAYYYGFMSPYRGAAKGYEESPQLDEVLTKEQAQEDLDYLLECVSSRHPLWLDEQSDLPELFAKQYDAEVASLSDAPTVLEVWQAAGRITAVLGDGHTYARANIYNERYINDYTEVNEFGTPCAINGEPTENIYARFLNMYQYDTETYADRTFRSMLVVRESYLRYLGIDVSEGVTFTFDTEEGKKDYSYSFVPADEIVGNGTAEEYRGWVYYDIDKENNAAVFTLTDCTYNDEYCAVVKEFFEQVRENGITNVIVDLRGNGGGSSMVANEFIRYLDVDEYKTWRNEVRLGDILIKNDGGMMNNRKVANPFAGDVYVLTNVWTYSSAMDFAMLIGDNDLGVIVGEASGNMPCSYGDCVRFVLPNSKLAVSVSHKKWYRVDESLNGMPLEPDYPTASREALDRVYELIAEK